VSTASLSVLPIRTNTTLRNSARLLLLQALRSKKCSSFLSWQG
jgi:hypothetical protein